VHKAPPKLVGQARSVSQDDDDTVFRMGPPGLTAPSVLSKIDPEYSQEARDAKIQGTVIIYLEVDRAGNARNLRVVRGLGMGLDEKAIEAVKQWRFKPGLKDGRPVIVASHIDIEFRFR